MEKCIRCNTPLEPGANFCPVCGTDQRFGSREKEGSTLLIVLCILTVVGSVFQMFRGMLYEIVADADNNNEYIRGWIYAITAVVTTIGAIMMFQKQLKGLYVYTAGQAIYLLTCFWATSVYLDDVTDSDRILVWIISSIFIIPAIIFLILFWMNDCKRVLR
ncbi:hypothetical protein HYN59_10735 [Flavobacterium album]|uniref:Zinc-ribbon domain-containing protein n=1 Tax=Flavobacterium album TaxID=2175091 RepID=A0A2S1QYR3_9FLAO|nr:zinc ribbon domain-containing protein [Flavobacterium album]AWH85556.1 hypothetical protein HYN59_10735 [Flavobacterium album]